MKEQNFLINRDNITSRNNRVKITLWCVVERKRWIRLKPAFKVLTFLLSRAMNELKNCLMCFRK